MREGWKTAKLGDLCEFRNGLWRGKKPPFVHVGVIRNTNFRADGSLDESDIAFLDVEQKQFDKRALKYGDLILEKSGGGPRQPVGRVVLFDKKDGLYSFSNFTSVIRVKDSSRLDFTYLHRVLYWYYISGATETMQRRSTGIRNLDFSTYKSIDIPLPPLPEQKRIVAILDEAFAGIATAVANTEKNLDNARELFESYLNAVFGNRNSGWMDSRKPLSDLCDLIVDCEHKTAPTQQEGVPSIRTTNIGKGKLLLDGVYRVSKETYREWTRRAEPLPGDLILAREAPAGNVAVIPKNLKVCLGQRTVLIRPKGNLFESEFLVLLLLQPQLQKKLLAHSRGATVQHVNMKDIRALDVGAAPSLSVQKDIVSAASRVSEEVTLLESIYQKKRTALAELKQSFLQKAFSGELTAGKEVSDAIRKVKEVA